MIRLHTWTTPNGRKASIALEELRLDYEVVPVDLSANAQMKPEFLKLNPNHKIPVLEDGDLVVWESGAILLHLGERHDPEGRILPKDPRQRLAAIQYAFFQTGGIGPNLGRLGAALRQPGEKNQEMIEIFRADNTAWSKKLGRVVMKREAPGHTDEDYIDLSGTKVREMLGKGIAPPPEFSRPEVAKVLMDYYRSIGG